MTILFDMAGSSAPEGEIKRKRAGGKHQMAACTNCKKRKKKCDGKYPSCGGCEHAGTRCMIYDYTTARIIPRDYIQTLEEKVSNLESQLKASESPESSIPHSKELFTRQSISSLISPNFEETAKAPPSLDSKKLSRDKVTDKTSGESQNLEMEIGYITLGAAAESRYIGNSSAFSIAKAITQSINYYQHKEISLSSKRQKTSDDDVDYLEPIEPTFSKPSKLAARNFLKSYKDVVQCQYPFLDWLWIEEACANVMENDSTDPEELFFIYMIFAIGIQVSSTDSTSMSYTKVYYLKAMENMSSLVEVTTLKTVQAYLLLAMFSQKMPEGSSIWQVVGIAIRSATILGLHREPYRKIKNNPDPEIQRVLQLRSRVFWCAYGIERINGIVLGRPFGISDADIDAPLPVETPDISIAIHVIKLRKIQLNICSFVYKPIPSLDSAEEIDATRVQIILELNSWVLAFPDKENPVSSFETKNWCQISYHNSLLLLLRPVVIEVSRLKKQSSSRLLEWFKVFAQSASAICMNYKDLHLKNNLGYTWLSMHCAFVAGLSFLYCLWVDNFVGVLEWKRRSLIYDTISSCSQILYVFAEKFKSAAMFRDTFESISGIVMMKLENEQTSHDFGNSQLTQSLHHNAYTHKRSHSSTLADESFPSSRFMEGVLNHRSIGIDQYLDFRKETNFEMPVTAGTSPTESFMRAKETPASSGPQFQTAVPKQQNFGNVDEEVWEFLDSTGDKFLRDIFYDMENQLRF